MEESVARTDLHDPPRVHHGDAIRGVGDESEIMRDEEDRESALLPKSVEVCDEAEPERRVERGRRLVRDEELRRRGERERERRALSLSAGELVGHAREGMCRLGEPGFGEQLERPRLRCRARHRRMRAHGLDELGADRLDRVERGERILKHEADAGPSERPYRIAVHVDRAPVEAIRRRAHRRGLRREAYERAGREGLAAARLSDEGEPFAPIDREVDRVDRDAPLGFGPESDREGIELEQHRSGHDSLVGPRGDIRVKRKTIVIGSGAAGSVIAARLTESADEDVALVESGPDYAEGSWPSDLADGSRNAMTSHDWGYWHRPTTVSGSMVFPRGRVIGGSSSVNTCIAIRGQPYDYDEWAEAGLLPWSFERCLPAFRRLETDLDFGETADHGGAGPIKVRRHPRAELAPFQAAFLDACAELSFPSCPDSNASSGTGAGPHAMNKVGGVRQSAARAYLTPAVRARPNLRILPRCDALRVILERGRAIAVEVVRDRVIERIDADRIVLAAGAIGTPAILLRSGIGPAIDLARLSVRCLVHSPGVGHRLLDHPGFAIFLAPRDDGFVRTADPLIQTVLRYHPTTGRPNEMQIQPGSFLPIGVDLPIVSLMSSLGKPTGHGSIRFESLALDAKPQLDMRFLDSPADMAKAIESVTWMTELLATKTLRRLVAPLLPGKSALRDERSIAGFVKHQCGSGYHPCGTAKMGVASDPFAVCDAYGRVRGVEGLYVGDASLMPTVPSANTHLPTLMIGERIGEWLRDGIPAT